MRDSLEKTYEGHRTFRSATEEMYRSYMEGTHTVTYVAGSASVAARRGNYLPNTVWSIVDGVDGLTPDMLRRKSLS